MPFCISGKPLNRWLTGSFDDLVNTKRVFRSRANETHSLPDLNDVFWKKRISKQTSSFILFVIVKIKMPKGAITSRACSVLIKKKLKICTLGILVSNLFFDRQCLFGYPIY